MTTILTTLFVVLHAVVILAAVGVLLYEGYKQWKRLLKNANK